MILRLFYLAIFFVAAALHGQAAYAVQPNEILSDAQLEARARAISADLRCLVCQNQSIDDSDADLAHDLRIVVRQRLQAGDSDAQVKDYMVARYGDYVLLQPPIKSTTILLWVGPIILLSVGSAFAATLLFRHKMIANDSTPLSKAEHEQLVQILDKKSGEL